MFHLESWSDKSEASQQEYKTFDDPETANVVMWRSWRGKEMTHEPRCQIYM